MAVTPRGQQVGSRLAGEGEHLTGDIPLADMHARPDAMLRLKGAGQLRQRCPRLRREDAWR